MGLLDRLFGGGSAIDGFMTDDESELRDYENSVYTSESGVTDSTYAEFVIEDVLFLTKRGLMTTGTVTGGVFKVGDRIQICRGEDIILESSIDEILQFKTQCQKVAEGANAGFLLHETDGNLKKLIKRNDIIKKV